MPPITWQNVTGRSLSEAAAPLEAAQKAMTAGFKISQVFLKLRVTCKILTLQQIGCITQASYLTNNWE